jgi:hypothetical protein
MQAECEGMPLPTRAPVFGLFGHMVGIAKTTCTSAQDQDQPHLDNEVDEQCPTQTQPKNGLQQLASQSAEDAEIVGSEDHPMDFISLLSLSDSDEELEVCCPP